MKNKFNPVLVKVKPKPNHTPIERQLTVTDERLFTSSRKLNSYLKMLNKYYSNLEITMKSYKVN